MDYKVISELALRRMRLEVTMHGGEVCISVPKATHLVAYSTSGSYDFDSIYKSFSSTWRHLLHDKKLHIVTHKWLDDSVDAGKKLPEDAYNLKPDNLEELKIQESIQASVPTGKLEKQTPSGSHTGEKRRRGKPANMSAKRGKTATRPARRTRARIGNRPAKIDSDVSENSDFSDEAGKKDVRGSGKDERVLGGIQDVNLQEGSQIVRVTPMDQDEKVAEDRYDEEHAPMHVMDSTEVVGSGEKLEQMVDPLHAMLLDMIPTLSQSKVDSKPASGSEIPQPIPEAMPAKKKVSYKEVAGQLLKDW